MKEEMKKKFISRIKNYTENAKVLHRFERDFDIILDLERQKTKEDILKLIDNIFVNNLSEKTKIQKCWIWNKKVEDFVRERIKGYSLNICSGKSILGDIKIDLNPQDKSVIKGDMRDLKFDDNTFDCVIQDPPWKIGFYERMRPFFERMRPFFECVRVCKVGGIIIYNAYWIPTSNQVKLKELWIRTDTDWANTSVISVFEKIGDKLK